MAPWLELKESITLVKEIINKVWWQFRFMIEYMKAWGFRVHILSSSWLLAFYGMFHPSIDTKILEFDPWFINQAMKKNRFDIDWWKMLFFFQLYGMTIFVTITPNTNEHVYINPHCLVRFSSQSCQSDCTNCHAHSCLAGFQLTISNQTRPALFTKILVMSKGVYI